MPELPEVETVKRTLSPRILGARGERVVVRRREVITPLDSVLSSSAAGSGVDVKRGSGGARRRQRQEVALLEADTIVGLRRHGKQLALVGASGRVMCFHLGMSGQVRVVERSTMNALRRRPEFMKHVHVVWELAPSGISAPGRQSSAEVGDRKHRTSPTPRNPRTSLLGRQPKANSQPPHIFMLFRDPRRFGGIWTAPDFDTLARERWSALGPDALTITPAQLQQSLATTTRSIKAVLLDQSVLAGVGNIYADEALFAAAIHPLRRADRLGPGEVARLADSIQCVLRRSIRAGGTTLRDYVDANGASGGFIPRLAVYGRAGEPCVECGRALRGRVVAQRSTVHCATCQPRNVHISVIHT